MEDKKTTLIYRILRWLIWLFSPKIQLVGTENLPREPFVAVGNHSQMMGPIAGELYFPGKHYIWCAGEMMQRTEVAEYAFRDFWSFKPRWTHWFFKLMSVLITPFSLCLFNNAHTIPVYHDTRLITTYRRSMELLGEGYSIVIFPEKNQLYNNILYEFQDKFVDLARFYYKKAGKELAFVPMYLSPALKTLVFGKPIRFRADVPIQEERARICSLLKEEITQIAASLPTHTVVPYRNIRRRDYPKNKPVEVFDREKNDG